MSRLHSTVIAFVLGAAATTGMYAAVHTARLGQTAAKPTVSARNLASRQAKLDAWSRSLHATLAKRPPALPKLPHFAPVPAQPAPPPPVATAQPPVTYVKAPTVVEYKHATGPAATTSASSGSDDGSDDEGSGEGGDAGGGD